MSCTIIIGGQYGSEGKGKVTALLANQCSEPWVVRCGGPNSGHSIWDKDGALVLRQLPAAALHPDAVLLIGAGCALDVGLLVSEIRRLSVQRERIVVDPRAVLIQQSDLDEELADVSSIGSTASGTNSACIRRMRRRSDARLATDSNELRKYVRVESVATLLHSRLESGGDVIVEGTQGFGLSLLHGEVYPYVTARDTSASGFCSEVGLSPRHVDFIVMVLRTFPIRVGGNSGPLPDEIDWRDVRTVSGAPVEEPELTSVTHRVRRVARFDIELVRRACRYNKPTSLAVMGLDRLDYRMRGVTAPSMLTRLGETFIENLEERTEIPVEWVGTGFRTADAIRIRHITTQLRAGNARLCPTI